MMIMGVVIAEKIAHFTLISEGESCYLILIDSKTEEETKILFDVELKRGNVWNLEIPLKSLDKKIDSYLFEVDGVRVSDPYGKCFLGLKSWGAYQDKSLIPAKIYDRKFNWGDEKKPQIAYEDMIIYHAHVRNFTMHPSSKVRKKGTFEGIIEKIPYLKELGITTLELAPIAEFSEIMLPDEVWKNPYGDCQVSGKVNCWGYLPAMSFAPKAAYAYGDDPIQSVKELVKKLHEAGIELIVEMYFDQGRDPFYAIEAVRYWVKEFHIDGVHVLGNAPYELLKLDPYLADVKLWSHYWGEEQLGGKRKRLGEYNDGFMNSARKFLKGDEGQLEEFLTRNRRVDADRGIINYIANFNGFTLYDMVSYERKHNEINGEHNQDGTDYNHTWNCGVEGQTKKKKIMELRKQQMKNALVLVFLSQGTPLLMAGDEFGNTQNGNNNTYCQDNELGWVNWKQKKNQEDLVVFVKDLIRFRKRYWIFRMSEAPRLMDYLALGYPDLSYHGEKPWYPEFENYRREVGILYCGKYGKSEIENEDSDFYVAYNMHWEPHPFALPHVGKAKHWYQIFQSSDRSECGFGKVEKELGDQKNIVLEPRSIVVLIGKR